MYLSTPLMSLIANLVAYGVLLGAAIVSARPTVTWHAVCRLGGAAVLLLVAISGFVFLYFMLQPGGMSPRQTHCYFAVSGPLHYAAIIAFAVGYLAQVIERK